MNKQVIRSLLSFILCVALIAAVALTTVGCNNTTETPETPGESSASPEGSQPSASPDATPPTVMGTGATVFYFNVVDKAGVETKFEIHTDKTVVGDALLELGLIQGENGPYGLYVKKVNGITADYEEDGTYWAFYVGDEYGLTGVDLTTIVAGGTYAFKVSK